MAMTSVLGITIVPPARSIAASVPSIAGYDGNALAKAQLVVVADLLRDGEGPVQDASHGPILRPRCVSTRSPRLLLTMASCTSYGCLPNIDLSRGAGMPGVATAAR
jgi:hypothetical protein